MTEVLELKVDKIEWGEGPWQQEPDRVDFEHAGLPCLLLRNPDQGHWCGYAAVPPGHPLHGVAFEEVPEEVHNVPGGLTYADQCKGHICHVPKPGEPDNVWWFGFDCGHGWDYMPGLYAELAQLRGVANYRLGRMDLHYWTVAEVQEQVKQLAEVLAAMQTGDSGTRCPTEPPS